MNSNQDNKPQEQQENDFQIRDFLYLCLAKWKWFVLSLTIVLGVAVIYILRTPRVYTRTASVLIKEDSQGKSITSNMEAFSDLGLFQTGTNVNNELIVFQSPAIMAEVVKRLKLNVNYASPGAFHHEVAYGINLPANVSFLDLTDNVSAGFTLQISQKDGVELSDFVLNDDDAEIDEIQAQLTDTITTPLGRIVIEPTLFFDNEQEYTLYISHGNLYNTVNYYTNKLAVALNNKEASVINLSFEDQSIPRAKDILSMVISVYNENWVKDKNQIAISTSMFINERLGMIERELGSVDDDISSYKSEHLLPDVSAISNMYIEKNSETGEKIMELNNQLYMTQYIESYLANEGNYMQLLPAVSGINNAHIEQQITDYNRQLLQRNSLVSNSSTTSPLVVTMDESLSAMRSAIIQAISNLKTTLNTQIESLEQSEMQTTSHIAANPTQAKYLLSVERQQKVKEALYLYLLQKREENELSQAFTAYNTRIVTPPHGSLYPTAPSRTQILMVAFLIGLIIPAGIVFFIESTNTKVRGRKDLDGVTIPFIGEIPLFMHRKKRLFGGKKTKKQKDEDVIVVKEGNRNVINEAFRVLRTNLEFMTGGDKKSNVVIITSFNPGSGKSFLALNIGVSLAIKQKRVLVIDGDFRHASVSSYIGSPKAGLSDYLSGRVDSLNDIIATDPKNEYLNILPVGTIPPNPTELLFGYRLKEVITTLREEFDYVLIDCPPIEMVADTQIIEQLADRTIFVVRSGLLERSMLADLENIYNENKYKNLCMVLNGSPGIGGRYGYRYGYRYSYRYGYYHGYGSAYHNYYSEKE
jgi:capsular exopolysaccharide synthesis family protein